jgi:2-oxoglutarate dehydrogenase E2 component (dihydrolipoamide succinyltransferase)
LSSRKNKAMPKIEFKLPRMGESITEATILKWMKNVGDFIDVNETLLEVGTDKVDSDVSVPFAGIIQEIYFKNGDVVPVGAVLALIEADDSAIVQETEGSSSPELINQTEKPRAQAGNIQPLGFLSPLIRNIVIAEGITLEELQHVTGSGHQGRIQKSDLFSYLKNRLEPSKRHSAPTTISTFPKPSISFLEGHDQVIEMDRMRKMIADHMVYSKHTSPHVTAYIEIDVTNLSNWRNRVKDDFQQKYGQKLTFTPLFVDAVTRAITDFPMINASIDGNKIIVHKDIHIGMATALPSGNLIVPVVRDSAGKTLSQLAENVNALADNARNNQLRPDDVQGSTFTISNVGTFGSLMGTPIINQPEVAILAFGVIKRRAEVILTQGKEEVAIRSMMFLSLSFDHRAVDGYLGGSFLRRVGDYLEQFDINSAI